MEELLNQLEELEFYEYEEPSTIKMLKSLATQTGSPLVLDGQYQYADLDSIVETDEIEVVEGTLQLYDPRPLNRLCFLSRKDLYQCLSYGFEKIKPILENYDVTVSDVDEYETDEGDRGITVNGVEYVICPEAINISGVNYSVRWNYTAAKFLMTVNTILSRSTSQERAYVIKELDEDGLYFAFLSPQINTLISESSIQEDEKPKSIDAYFSKYFEAGD
jgi:hypothetical protein